MADKNFKVKNKLVINGLAGNAGPLVADASNVVDSTPYIATQYGGTGTTTSPSSGQVLYSASGTTYTPTTFSSLPGVYARGNTASRPASPNVGDLYFNSELSYFESYTTNGWFPIAAAPGIPTAVTATNQPSGRAFNNGQMSVAFSASTSGGAPTSFIVTPTPTTSPSTFTVSSSPVTITGLSSSTQYTYTVAATSPYGTSSASSASTGVTATTVPQAPTINSVTAASQSAIINFTAGATGGSSITSYSIISNPVTTTQTATSSPYTFTGLTDGELYTFTMTATNANGTSLASSASSPITPVTNSGVMFPIAMVNIGTNTSTITFNSIPDTYKHLQLRGIMRTSRTAGNDLLSMRFNNDSGGNYSDHALGGDGSTAYTDKNVSASFINVQRSSSNFNGSNIFGVYVIDILDYTSTSKNKTTRALGGYDANGSGEIYLNSGLWRNSSTAINRIDLILPSYTTNFTQYSQFALYGING